MKKVVYIAGPITGVDKYWEAFEQAEDMLASLGYIPLLPSRLPQGMTPEQYARVCLAMIDAADATLFLPGWHKSDGASLERAYCMYIGKPAVELRVESLEGTNPPHVVRAWLEHDLKEVMA